MPITTISILDFIQITDHLVESDELEAMMLRASVAEDEALEQGNLELAKHYANLQDIHALELTARVA